MKVLVVLPTYNEAENINKILDSLTEYTFLDVLVVDDNSTDGTLEKLQLWLDESDRVHLLKRPGKMGLGSAYIAGFKWGMERGYDYFFEIDADLSHDPVEIPNFIKKVESGADFVVGSRYMNGTISVVGWDFRRLMLSKFGNWYSAIGLGLKEYTDVTSGYRCITRRALEAINLDVLISKGYAFQIEMVYKAVKAGMDVGEVPIIFYERTCGGSKMNKKIVLEAMFLPFKLRFGK